MRSSNSAKTDRPENSFRLAKADAFGWRADGMAGVYQSVQKLANLFPCLRDLRGFDSILDWHFFVWACRSTALRVAECFFKGVAQPSFL